MLIEDAHQAAEREEDNERVGTDAHHPTKPPLRPWRGGERELAGDSVGLSTRLGRTPVAVVMKPLWTRASRGATPSPWLDIPLADYEGHMGLPEVAQAELLADVFAALLDEHSPRSVAVLGCSGGNGFDRICPSVTERVVGVDINSTYIDATRTRFRGRFRSLELLVGDLQSDDFAIEPADFVYAALLFEYLELPAAWRGVLSCLRTGGILGTVVQLPARGVQTVTPSGYESVQALAPCMRLVSPEKLRDSARTHGCEELKSHTVGSRAGKQFQVQVFRLNATR
jgi:hypothetical protein